MDVKRISYKGQHGRDFRIEGLVGGRFTAFCRLVLVDDRVLQINAIYEGELVAPPDALYSQMLGSLTL